MSKLTRRQTASRLGVSVALVRRHEAKGDLHGEKGKGGATFYDVAQVEQLAAARAARRAGPGADLDVGPVAGPQHDDAGLVDPGSGSGSSPTCASGPSAAPGPLLAVLPAPPPAQAAQVPSQATQALEALAVALQRLSRFADAEERRQQARAAAERLEAERQAWRHARVEAVARPLLASMAEAGVAPAPAWLATASARAALVSLDDAELAGAHWPEALALAAARRSLGLPEGETWLLDPATGEPQRLVAPGD